MERGLAVPPPDVLAGARSQCEAPLQNRRNRRRAVTVLATLATCASLVGFGACFTDLPVGVLVGGISLHKILRGYTMPTGFSDRCGQNCSRQTKLQNMLDLTFVGDTMEGWTWENCALVGAGDDLKDAGRGPEIDSHYPVIRINRFPHAGVFDDFGQTMHVVFANDRYMDEGRVASMRQGVPMLCHRRAICSNASIVFRRLEAESNYAECPQDLLRWWGPSHPFLGCSADLVLSLARRLQGLGGLPQSLRMQGAPTPSPSTGFVAFMTFAPLCKKMNVFGFPKDSRKTADGHEEFPKHNLEIEHDIERLIAKRNFSAIKVTDDWQNQELRLWRWLQIHVGEITFIGD